MNLTKKSFYRCTLSIIIVVLTMICLTGQKTVYASTLNNNRDFDELQATITSSLTLRNDKYDYNEAYIRSLVNQFDIDYFNEKYSKDYTNETLSNMIIDNISSYTYVPQIVSRATCNLNHSTSGWNYVRRYVSNGAMKDYLYEARKAINLITLGHAVNAAIAGAITGGAGAAAVAIIGAFDVWYWTTLVDAVEYENNGCGSVFDINSFTSWFDVWDQRNK